MRTLSKLLFALIVTISCISCEKIENGDNNNSNNNDINKQEDFYYVRFEASSSQTAFISVKVSLTGSESFSTSGGFSFSEILGPAKRGAIASIRTMNGNGLCNTAIYVSKNNGPFALKKMGNLSLEYTIDF
jgi:hypothetical protein